jgi:hypothetical protein
MVGIRRSIARWLMFGYRKDGESYTLVYRALAPQAQRLPLWRARRRKMSVTTAGVLRACG